MIKGYEWLEDITPPRMLAEGLKLFGTYEGKGDKDNPEILRWAKELNLKEYQHDETPWCGLFMAICAKRANWPVPRQPLWALNWQSWQRGVIQPMLGDVMVFKRVTALNAVAGHVAMYVGEDDTHWHILGGNQMDMVSIVRRPKGGWFKARRPLWRVGEPSSVRPYVLSSTGLLSGKED